MLILDKCNRCGKDIDCDTRYTVTCKGISFWEHDTKRYLCEKCYKKFEKYMRNHYYKYFTYEIEEQKKGENKF